MRQTPPRGLAMAAIPLLLPLLLSCHKPDAPRSTPPICTLGTDTLDFGPIFVGHGSILSFSVTNTGGGTLSGTVAAAGPDYRVLPPSGYTLRAGQTWNFFVRFTPSHEGPDSCLVSTGCTGGGRVLCVGSGFVSHAPICTVSPESLNFGAVTLGKYRDLHVVVSNLGGGTLFGLALPDVRMPCTGFTVVRGGTWTLGSGQSDTIVVRFSSTELGYSICRLNLVDELDHINDCTSIVLTGTSDQAPRCSFLPATLDFLAVPPGTYTDTTIDITNFGGGTLVDTLVGCGPFHPVGDSTLSLQEDESATLKVRFTPFASADYSCALLFKHASDSTGACHGIFCTGSGKVPACQVVPSTLDFGTIPRGTTLTLPVTITNVGLGTLSGYLDPFCNSIFSLSSGNARYSLAPGQSQTFYIWFNATRAALGSYSCGYELNSTYCPRFQVKGTIGP